MWGEFVMQPGSPAPGSPEWFAQVDEEVMDPGREIVDPHHHLWPEGGALPYGIADLSADTLVGHRVVQTVFIECHASYETDGPRHLRPVGETRFVASSDDEMRTAHPDAPPIAGIVASADLTLETSQLDEVLDAHVEAAGGRFVGIRDALARALEPEVMAIAGTAPEGKSADPAFQAGVRHLGERGLTYDSWHYHYQLTELAEVADAAPDTTIVHDHFGTPLAVGQFEGKTEEIFAQWQIDTAALAERPNVVAKLGGMAMPDNGFGWHAAARPPTSDEFVEAQARWYHHTIECFGAERCMFESNFPVDRLSLSYSVLWNALKKIASEYSEDEQAAMFAGTARRTYRI